MLLVLCLVTSALSCEIITLIKNENVTCVVKKTAINSPIYISPPVETKLIRQKTRINNWQDDDWLIQNSTEFMKTPVTDKRWEDFPIYDGSHISQLKNGLAYFSIYTDGNITITTYSKNFSESSFSISTPTASENIDWVHYSILEDNGTLKLYSEEELLHSTELNFTAVKFALKNTNLDSTSWKLHSFDARVSYHTSQDKPSKVLITFRENLCISMFVSLCEDCVLNIQLVQIQRSITRKVIGPQMKINFKYWKQVEIQATYPGEAQLFLTRTHLNAKETDGYWAISDLEFFSQNLDIYRAQFENKPASRHICEELRDPNKLPSVYSSQDFTRHQPGCLDKNCTINCTTVLGTSLPYCENHRICLTSSNCFCSWGFEGPSCENSCPIGKWGLLCKDTCTNCTDCNSSTGKCLQQSTSIDKSEFPLNISLQGDDVLVFLPQTFKSQSKISYQFQYLCVSEWCQDTIIKKENITISSLNYQPKIIHHCDNLTPFTNVQPIVTIQKFNQTLEKNYPIIRASQGISTLNNISVYCSNTTSLWVKFEKLEGSLDYSAWYHQHGSNVRPRNLSNVYKKCDNWHDFLCIEITGLKSHTFYEIIVDAMDSKGHTYRTTKIIGITDSVFTAPTNLEVSRSRHGRITLNWEYPLVTYRPLTCFNIAVDNGTQGESYTKCFKQDERIYHYSIPLVVGMNYNISVRGLQDQCEGEEAALRSIFMRQVKNEYQIVHACDSSSECYYVLPSKPSSLNISRDDNVSNEYIKNYSIVAAKEKINSSDSDSPAQRNWTVTDLIVKDDLSIQLRFNKKEDDADFLQDWRSTYFYLKNNENGDLHPLNFNDDVTNSQTSPTSNSTGLIIVTGKRGTVAVMAAVIAVVVITGAVIAVARYCDRKKCRNQNVDRQEQNGESKELNNLLTNNTRDDHSRNIK